MPPSHLVLSQQGGGGGLKRRGWRRDFPFKKYQRPPCFLRRFEPRSWSWRAVCAGFVPTSKGSAPYRVIGELRERKDCSKSGLLAERMLSCCVADLDVAPVLLSPDPGLGCSVVEVDWSARGSGSRCCVWVSLVSALWSPLETMMLAHVGLLGTLGGEGMPSP